MRDRASLTAAVVNGVVVLLLPALGVLLFYTVHDAFPERFPTAAVHAHPISPIGHAYRAGIIGLFLMLPLACVAAWRTWVHATRWQRQQRTARGIAEAGCVGVLLVIAMLAPLAVASRSIGAFFAIPIYAAIGGLVGLVLGVVLHLTAVAVLKLVSLRGKPAPL